MLTLPRLTVSAGIGVNGLAQLLAARTTPARRAIAATKRMAWQALLRALPPAR